MENENNDPIKNVGGEKEEVKEAQVVNDTNTSNVNANKEMNVVCLLSFIFSMIGLIVFGIPCGIAAIVLGIIGLATTAKKQISNKWMGITGLVVGILDVVAVWYTVTQVAESLL